MSEIKLSFARLLYELLDARSLVRLERLINSVEDQVAMVGANNGL